MNQQFKLTFNLEDEDSELYNKYGKKAVELGSQGNYDEAIKLLDKVLAKKQKTEFALLLKANYYFNKVNEELELNDPATPEEIPLVKKQASKIKKELTECLNLVEKVLKINPKNEGAKQIKKFIENNSMKEVENLLKTIKKTSKNIPSRKFGCKLICPYCNNEYIKEFGTDEKKVKDEFIEECPKCSKEYKVLSGKVTLWRSRGTGVVSFGLPEYTIRIKNQDGERMMIFNSNYNLLHIKTGDGVYFTFKKKFLSSSFSDKPSGILNANTNTHSLI
jgi:tetratricopeptide (TPR) repeat protein